MRKLHLYALSKLVLAHRRVARPVQMSSVVNHDAYMHGAQKTLRQQRELQMIKHELAELHTLLDESEGVLNSHEISILRKTVYALEKKREEKEKKLAKDL